MDPDHIWYLLATGEPCKPHENAVKQCRNPQYYTWNASGDHILALSSLLVILLIWTQSVYGCLKRCAHIASTVQNDGPDSRSKEGAGSIQSERSVLNSFAYVQQVSLAMEGNFRKPKLLVQFHHISRAYKSTETL